MKASKKIRKGAAEPVYSPDEPPREPALAPVRGPSLARPAGGGAPRAAIVDSALELDAILQGLSEGVTVRDAEARLVFANDAAALACGFASAEQMLSAAGLEAGLERFEIFDQEGRPVPAAALAGLPAPDQKPSERLLRFRLRDARDEDRWMVVRSTPAKGADGALKYAINTLRDVTRNRRASDWQAFLGEASAAFSSSFDYPANLEDMADAAVRSIADWCVIDLQGPAGGMSRLALRHCDPAQRETAQRLAAGMMKALGAPSSAPAADGPAVAAPLLPNGRIRIFPRVTARLLAAFEPDPQRLALLRGLGVRSAMLIPLLVRGEIVGVVTLVTAGAHARGYSSGDRAVAAELARRASLSIDNARLYADAQEAVRSREDLLAIVSHDLRNPLGVVLTSSALLLRGPLPPEKEERARRQIEAIQRAGNRMNRLIGDLLDFASIQGGHLSISKHTHDAVQLVGDVLESMEPLAAQKRQRLIKQVPPEPLKITCDRDRMVQVFSNVVGNAIKFTPEGGEVAIRAERRGATVVFSVADSGPGMSPEELGNVFDRYWQAQRKNRDGIGLGLSIVKGIIDAHGGRVWAESVVDGGTTFYLTLPA